MDSDLLGRELAGLFDRGASEIRLEEVERRTVEASPRRPPHRSAPLVIAGAFLLVVVAGIGLGLLNQGPEMADTPYGHVYLSTDTQLTVVDIAAATMTAHDLPELAPGDPPYRLTWRGERLVFYGETGLGRAVMSLDPADPNLSTMLVKEGAFFIPSAHPERVWTFESAAGAVLTMQELTARGAETTAEVPTPDGLWPAAAVTSGVLFQGDETLDLWRSDGDGLIDTLPGPFPVATWQNRLVTCGRCDEVVLIDLDDSTERTVGLPAGIARVDGYGGAFSPDGRYVAALGFVTSGELTPETEMEVVLIDFEEGSASVVPGSLTTNRFGSPGITWSSSGWLFIGPIVDDDTEDGRLIAYRPGEDTYTVPVEIETLYYGMAAD